MTNHYSLRDPGLIKQLHKHVRILHIASDKPLSVTLILLNINLFFKHTLENLNIIRFNKSFFPSIMERNPIILGVIF